MNDTHDNPTTPIDEQLWQCPECGHEMTERESKLYRGCPTGMHFVQHIKVRKEQPLPNPATGEWTKDILAELQKRLPSGYHFGQFVADAHNAALSAERKKTKQAWREHDDVAKALAEFSETIKQLGARNQQLREQLTTTDRTLEAAQQRANELSEDLEHYSEVIDKREATLEAAYENHKADVARLNDEHTMELNAKLDQINAQAGTIKELVQLLTKVDRMPDTPIKAEKPTPPKICTCKNTEGDNPLCPIHSDGN